MVEISICVCTYKREFLKKTLQSLINQDVPLNFEFEIIVVDNDYNGTGRSVVENLSSNENIKISYVIEPIQGICNARNTAVLNSNFELLAFIDDDEIAEPNWLHRLYDGMIKYDADVIIGAVETIYPDSTPIWIVEGDYFGRKSIPTGLPLKVAGIGNCLIKKSSLPDGVLFDNKYNFTGGEDTDLFTRMNLMDRKILSCKEALVREVIMEHRLNSEFLLKKALRVGETYQLIILNKKPFSIKLLYLIKNLSQWFLGYFLYVALSAINNKSSFGYLLKSTSNKGKVLSFLKIKSTKLYL